IRALRHEAADDARQDVTRAAARQRGHLMWVFADPAIRMSNDGAGALQDDDRPPLPGRLASRAWAVRVDRLRRLAGQPRQLARVRRRHAPAAELAFRAARV